MNAEAEKDKEHTLDMRHIKTDQFSSEDDGTKKDGLPQK